jgi:CRP-like cAMP-binding protein
MYIVASGQVQLHKEGRVLAELGFGSCVGQAALLQHSQHAGVHIASATAVTECIVLSISRASLDSLMKETPSLSRGVLNAVASSLRWLYYEVRYQSPFLSEARCFMSLLSLIPL